MKRNFLALFIIVLLVVLTGCDEKITYSYEDLKGEWISLGIYTYQCYAVEDDPTDKKLDIRVARKTIPIYLYGGWYYTGATFTGTTYNNVSMQPTQRTRFFNTIMAMM